MSLLRERRRCPLKSWGPSGGNDFWGNPQEGGQLCFRVQGHFARSRVIGFARTLLERSYLAAN